MGKKSRRRRERESGDSALVRVELAELAERRVSGPVFTPDGILDTTGVLAPWSATSVTEMSALAIDAVYACVTTIADAVASADVGEWRGTSLLEPSRLVLQPMASYTRREWLWRVAAILALYNAAGIQELGPVLSDGMPSSLRPIIPAQISVTNGAVLVDGAEVPPGSVHIWRRSTWPTVSFQLGTLLELARETFAAAMSADTYRSDFWQQGGAPVVVLTTDQELEDGQADTIRERWSAMRSANPGKPAVLEKGATAKAFGADLGTEGANMAGDKLRASIARYFRVPADMVNAPSEAGSLTYSTTEDHNTQAVRYTFSAYTDTIGDGWSNVLPGNYLTGRVVRLGLRHLMAPAMLARFQAYQIALDAPGHPGWMTAAEIRALEGLPPDLALPSAGTPAPAAEAIPAAEVAV